MNLPIVSCQTERRRQQVQHTPHVAGLDYLDVSENQRTLTAYFLGKAPTTIAKANIRIEGGRRIQNIQVMDFEVLRNDDPELDDALQVVVDRPGDFSEYQLRLVEVDADGHPTDRPLQGVDPRYAQVSFSFKVGCPSDLDCKQPVTCPEPIRAQPDISYLAKDYSSFRQLILDRLSLIMPDWQERHVPDVGMTIAELLAYVGDTLSYYQDAVATEAYLNTARQRISVRRHARLMDYVMHEGCNARAWVCVETSSDITIKPQDIYFITGYNDRLLVPDRTLQEADLRHISADQYEVFEPMSTAPMQLFTAHNAIHFYTWGDRECCLPKGATAATLMDAWKPVPEATHPPADSKHSESKYVESKHTDSKDSESKYVESKYVDPKDSESKYVESKYVESKYVEPKYADSRDCDPTPPPSSPPKRELNLHPGDILILEEVLGPKTGNPADADITHRHVVRLTHVEPEMDALYNQPIVNIEWSVEEALPFPLCLSGLGPAPECHYIKHISVARGNVMLVDHGRTIAHEHLGQVAEKQAVLTCEGANQPSDGQSIPERFTPTLQQPSLTFRQPLLKQGAAAHWLRQDPHAALPHLTLVGVPSGTADPIPWQTPDWQWIPQPDLLASHPRDRHVVVEMANDRQAHLRFGNGEMGELPAPGTNFWAAYRVGNGMVGNVGAETISHIVLRQTMLSGMTLTPRNPLPAQGGTDPEPLADVKLFAPQTFRRTLQRAITPDDYARLAEQYTDTHGRRVQRAAATLRWTGNGYDVVVAIDQLGQDMADPSFLSAIARYLNRYRRIGYGLQVVAAQTVPLDIALKVCVLPHALRAHVKADLLDRFSDRRLVDGTLGFFHPDNLSFGDAITISKLVTAALSVSGIASVNVTKLQRLDHPPNQELENGILPLQSFEIAQLDNDPNFPEHGKLTLDAGGGR